MLQTSKSSVRPYYAASDAVSPVEALQFSFALLRRRLSLFIGIVIFTVSCSLIYLAAATPQYVGRALLIIDARKPQISQQQVPAAESPIDTLAVDSQIEILRSDNLALTVIKKLSLLDYPEFGGAREGQLSSFPRLFANSDRPKDLNEINFVSERRAVDAFHERLDIRRVGTTYVIQISFRSSDPDLAAHIANGIAEAYVRDQLDAKYEAAKAASTWLQDRIKDLREQMGTAEQAVVDFKTKNGIVSTGGADKRLVGEQQIVELNTQLTIARAATAEAKAKLDRIGEVLRAGNVNATVTDALKSETVTKLRSQYFELAFREADWSTRYGPDHQAAVNLRSQMAEITKAIFGEVSRIGETYKSDFEISKQREDEIRKELALAVSRTQTSDSAQITLDQLEGNAQSYKTLYNTFLQRYQELVQQQSFPITEARLISNATRPLNKSSPNSIFVIGISSLLGSLIGFGAAWLRDRTDRVFRTGDEVSSVLDLECLALIPNIATSHASNVKSKKRKYLKLPFRPATAKTPSSSFKLGYPSSVSARTIVLDGKDIIRTVVDRPLSAFTESLRSIKLSIDLSRNGRENIVIGLTSAVPNEGKSTVAGSLAQLISKTGSRCLLVDCDLRNPTLSSLFAPRASVGIVELLAGKCRVEDVLWRDPLTGMDFLPSISSSRLAGTSDILASDAAKHFFAAIRGRYDYVLVDCSPLAPVVDVRATTHLFDTYIFVVEWGATKMDLVDHALRSARELRENLLGVVLNKVDFNLLKQYGSKYRKYHDNAHHERYGIT